MSDRPLRPGIRVRLVRPGEAEARADPALDGWLARSVEERLAGVWELTKLCLAWNQEGPGEPRLQRSVVRLVRRGR